MCCVDQLNPPSISDLQSTGQMIADAGQVLRQTQSGTFVIVGQQAGNLDAVRRLVGGAGLFNVAAASVKFAASARLW